VKKISLLLILAGVALAFFGCTSPNASISEVKIGVVLPLSGNFKIQGNNVLSGVQLAIKEINHIGGINNRPVRLIIADDTGDPVRTKEIMLRMIEFEKVSAILGGYSTEEGLAMRTVAEEKKIPCMAIGASNCDITENVKYMFRVGFDDMVQARGIARFMRTQRFYEQIAVFVDLTPEATYARGLGLLVAQEFMDQGGAKPVLCGYRSDDPASRDAAIAKALKFHSEAIFTPSYYEEQLRCITAIRKTGFGGLIIGSDGAVGDFSTIQKTCGDFVYPTVYSPGNAYAPGRAFRTLYFETYKKNPDHHAALGYDAGKSMAEAFRNHVTEPGDAAKSLRDRHTYDSVVSKVARDEDGRMLYTVFMITVLPDGPRELCVMGPSMVNAPLTIKH